MYEDNEHVHCCSGDWTESDPEAVWEREDMEVNRLIKHLICVCGSTEQGIMYSKSS